MAMMQMLIASGFAQVVHTYATGSGATETAPTGASNVKIEVWGASGASGEGGNTSPGGGAAGGGYSVTNTSISGGQTLTYTVGVGGVGGAITPSNPGTASSCSSGTKTITTMTANGGSGYTGNATSGSSTGGTASGGTTSNTSGGSVANTNIGGLAGDGRAYSNPGGGPNGATIGTGNPGITGSNGQVQFTYT